MTPPRKQPPSPAVLVHIISWNSEDTLSKCIDSVLSQTGFTLGSELFLEITDNNSNDSSKNILETFEQNHKGIVSLIFNKTNEGFCRPNNLAFARAHKKNIDFVFILNPDTCLHKNCLKELVKTAQAHPNVGAFTPLILRGDENLDPIEPQIVDSAGIYFTPSLRHFDRSAGQELTSNLLEPRFVFGGTGAALLFRSECLKDLALSFDKTSNSLQVFDEDFFAYREDADLAWRMQSFGWPTLYVPTATLLHQRTVTPEARGSLSERINALGVQNRFLLQFANCHFMTNYHCLLAGGFRNLLVVGASLTIERSSTRGLIGAWKGFAKCLQKRRFIQSKAKVCPSTLAKWFANKPYTEAVLAKSEQAKSLSNSKPLTVIIVSYKASQRLAKALSPLIKLKNSQPNLNIVVVNNSRESLGLAQDNLPIRIISPEKNLGFSGAINAAASEFPNSSAFLILNPDIEIQADSVITLFNTINKYSNLGAIAPILLNHQGLPQYEFNARGRRSLSATIAELLFLHRIWPNNPATSGLTRKNDPSLVRYLDRARPNHSASKLPPLVVEQPPAACLMVSGNCFRDLQGFDSSFWPAWFEDVDFCIRAKKRNWILALDGAAEARHEGGYSKDAISPGDYSRAWYGNLFRFGTLHYKSSIIEYIAFRTFFFLGVLLRLPLALLKARGHGLRVGLDYGLALLVAAFAPGKLAQGFSKSKLLNQEHRARGPKAKSTVNDNTPNLREHFAGHLFGNGLELGPLHRPIVGHDLMKTKYVDRMSNDELRTHYPELSELDLVNLDYIDNAESLNSIKTDSQDYLIASHLIEHLANPLQAIESWCRVVKPGGLIYIVAPHKDFTFDKKRTITSLEHIILDYRTPSKARDSEHYLDYTSKVSGLEASAAVKEARCLIERDYSIHFHVFTPDSLHNILIWLAAETGLFTIVEGPRHQINSEEFHFLLKVSS